MSNSSHIDTDTWRLPPQKHSVPEASFTDEMYRKVGLPTAPASVAGGAGRPVVDTSDWRLPTSRSLEEAEDGGDAENAKAHAVTDQAGFARIFDSLKPKQTVWVSYSAVMSTASKEFRPYTVGTKSRSKKYNVDSITLLRAGQTKSAGAGMQTKLMKRGDKVTIALGDMGASLLGMYVPKTEGSEASEGTKFSFLVKRAKSKGQDAGPKRQPDDDAVDEAFGDKPGKTQQVIINLLTKHGPMDMGDLFDALVKKTGLKGPAIHKSIYLMLQRNKLVHPDHDSAKVALPSTKSESDLHTQRRLAGLEESKHLVFATGTPHRRMPEPLTEADHERIGFGGSLEQPYSLVSTKKKSAVTSEMRRLAGMTEDVGLPRPLHDTRPLQTPKAHGILDDGADEGEAYVERVLAESRWFFGDVRPFDEAPGSRRPPWQGSKDIPAETPIVRKGEVQGTVGKTTSPEAHGEVDVGKSEIDYDFDPDEDHEKQTDVHKKKAPPEDEATDDEEVEGVEEARDREGGGGLKALGRGMRAAGHRMATGSAAQRAKAGLSAALHKFAAKHGIDTDVYHSGKRAAQRELSGKAAKDEKKKKEAAKAKAAAATKSSGGGKAQTSVKKPSFLKKTKAPPRPVPKAK